jgi:hypothetical protein
MWPCIVWYVTTFPKDLPPTSSTLVVKPQQPSEKWDSMVWIGNLQMDRSGGGTGQRKMALCCTVRSWYAHGTLKVSSRYAHGTISQITVCSRYAQGQLTVCSRYAHGQLTVRQNILGLYLDAAVHTPITVTSRWAQGNAQLNHKHFDYSTIVMELDNNTWSTRTPWRWHLGAETCSSWYPIWSVFCDVCFIVF